MKNNDGIEIKVGQKWKSEGGMIRKILAVCDKQFVTSTQQTMIMPFKCWGLGCINTTLHTLISDPSQPWLPLPEGRRLATGEERRDNDVPKDSLWFDTNCPDSGWMNDTPCGAWSRIASTCHIAIPTDFTFEPKKPKYRLFEIDWTHNYPLVRFGTKIGDHSVDLVGQRIDGYRIFGFTDQSNIIDIECIYKCHIVPCDQNGNRKFAVGRLEE